MAIRKRRSVDERIDELKERIEKLQAVKNKRTRTEENRRRHLVGLVVLEEVAKDSEIGRVFKKKLAPLLIEKVKRDNDKELLSDML